jgi:hypothetical protein
MRTRRQRLTARVLLALALLLGSVWVGDAAASAAGDPAGRLADGRSRAAVEAAVLRDRAPALRPAPERPGPPGPALLVTLVAALAGVTGWRAVGVRLHPAGGHQPVRAASLGARSPPHLQPA